MSVFPTKSLAVYVWSGAGFTPWEGSGSDSSNVPGPNLPLEGVALYFFDGTKWSPWDGTLTGSGGGTVAGVTKIIAGTNITISPTTGVGDVTINATGSGPTSDLDFSQIFMLMGA